MGAISIIGFGSGIARGSPPLSDWGALYNLLENVTPARIVLNGYGDVTGIAASGELFTPSSVAQFIAEGNIYVDWCGLPFFYQESQDGSVATLGTSGWGAFAQAMKYPALAGATWTAPGSLGGLGPPGVMFPSLNGVYVWRATVDGVPMVLNQNEYLVFALHHSGIGWYFWAEPPIPFYEVMTGYYAVSASAYAQFITQCLHGEIQPAAQYTAPSTGGGGGSGTGNNNNNKGGPPPIPKTTGPSPWTYVGIGAAAVGIGGLAYYLYGRA